MLLRSVTRHVREQNWFAVTLDFLIVVVGVFIGIQVSNWNDERRMIDQERAFLAQLREEVVFNVEATKYQEQYAGVVVEAGRRVLAFLEGELDCGAECADLITDVFHATQVWGTGYREGKFREMERLGLPTDPTLRIQIERFYLHLDGWDVVNSFAPAFRESARGHITPQAFEHLWRDCYRLIEANIEELTKDCVTDLRELDTRAMLERLHAETDLRKQLQFWLLVINI